MQGVTKVQSKAGSYYIFEQNVLAKPTKPVSLGTSPPSWTQLMYGHLDRPGEGSGLPRPGFGVTYSTTLTTTTTTGKRVYQHC